MAEQEAKVGRIFTAIEAEFRAFESISNNEKAEAKLNTITGMIREAKNVIKEFEREARIDGVPPEDVLRTKGRLVNQVNGYVAKKKASSDRVRAERAAMQASQGGAQGAGSLGTNGQQKQMQEMGNQEIVDEGRRVLDETDAQLKQGVRIVHQTEETAVKTAEELKKQTEQMGRIVDDLNEIEFSMQRASKVIRDIARGLVTDKFIMFLIFVVAAGIVAVIVLEILGVGDDVVNIPGPENQAPPADNGGRKLLSSLGLETATH